MSIIISPPMRSLMEAKREANRICTVVRHLAVQGIEEYSDTQLAGTDKSIRLYHDGRAVVSIHEVEYSTAWPKDVPGGFGFTVSIVDGEARNMSVMALYDELTDFIIRNKN